MAASFLVGLRVEGRRCVVIGGDADALDRARSLADAGARVDRYGATDDAHGDPRIASHASMPTERDLDGAFLVVATPRDETLARALYARANAPGGFLLCCVDQPAYCTFVHVASVRRGPLQIAVATDGQVPAIAAAIRRAMDAQLGDDLAAWVRSVSAVRNRTPPAGRADALRRALEGFEWTVGYRLPVAGREGQPAAEPEHDLRDDPAGSSSEQNGNGPRDR